MLTMMVGIVMMGLGLMLLIQQQHARISTNVTVRADRIAWIRRSGRLVRKVPYSV